MPSIANDLLDHWEVIAAGEVEHVTFYVATAEHTEGGDPPIYSNGGSPGGSAGGDSGSDVSKNEGTVAVELFGCSPDVANANAANCNTWAGKVSIELESFESGVLFTLAHAEPRDDGSYFFRAPFRSDVVGADLLTGNSVRSIRVNGNTVQNPTVGVNDAQPHSMVHVFFSN